MCTSLQTIVMDTRLQQDIEPLFQYKHYPRFQLRQFYTHPLFQQNEQFHFFIDILQEWNRKQTQQQLPNCSYTLYYKNVYIYNNLRTAILQLPPYAHLILRKLYEWYNSTRNNKIRVIQKKQQEMVVDETWEIRNTFKSNLPAEIDLYRRRMLWDFSDKENLALTKSVLNDSKSRKMKTQSENDTSYREVQQKRVIKIENELVRYEREKNELMEVEARWKTKKAREEEFMVKNYYNGAFSASKTYFPKRSKPDPEVTHPILKRSQTSAGIRNYRNALSPNSIPQNGPIASKITVRKSLDKTEKFQEFEASQVRLSDVTGLNLLVNPNEKKLKKRRRRK